MCACVYVLLGGVGLGRGLGYTVRREVGIVSVGGRLGHPPPTDCKKEETVKTLFDRPIASSYGAARPIQTAALDHTGPTKKSDPSALVGALSERWRHCSAFPRPKH